MHIKTESGLPPVTTLTGDGFIPPAFEVFFRYQEFFFCEERETQTLLSESRVQRKRRRERREREEREKRDELALREREREREKRTKR